MEPTPANQSTPWNVRPDSPGRPAASERRGTCIGRWRARPFRRVCLRTAARITSGWTMSRRPRRTRPVLGEHGRWRRRLGVAHRDRRRPRGTRRRPPGGGASGFREALLRFRDLRLPLDEVFLAIHMAYTLGLADLLAAETIVSARSIIEGFRSQPLLELLEQAVETGPPARLRNGGPERLQARRGCRRPRWKCGASRGVGSVGRARPSC